VYDDSILEAARKAKEAGAIRFSIVTSGRNTSNPNEFNQILRVLKEIREKIGLEIIKKLEEKLNEMNKLIVIKL